MIVVGRYSFNKGLEVAKSKYAPLLEEIEQIISRIDASQCKTKKSKEKTMPGRVLYSPKGLNNAFGSLFSEKGWSSPRVKCEYPTQFYGVQVSFYVEFERSQRDWTPFCRAVSYCPKQPCDSVKGVRR